MAGCRYGADILGDLARLSLTDPDAGEPDPAASPEVPFEAIVVKQHKWQVRGHRITSVLLVCVGDVEVSCLPPLLGGINACLAQASLAVHCSCSTSRQDESCRRASHSLPRDRNIV